MTEQTTHFGYQQVPVSRKQKLVAGVFDSVAGKYDLMNDLMSFGLHRLWKRHFVATISARPGDTILDLAGGTGDIAALLQDQVGPTGNVVIADINAAMLRVGRARMVNEGRVQGLNYGQVNAECLPFQHDQFDGVTMAFGLRNVTDQNAALRSIYDVLKPGGQIAVLEFSQVQDGILKTAYDFHSFQVLPRLGKWIANDAESYQYLAESIRQHPPQEKLKAMMQKAGFADVQVRNILGGIVAIHTGYKL